MQLPEDRFISAINGNIVHVTVNNFINTEKKASETTTSKIYNARPFSSDAKDREKKINPVTNARLFGTDAFSTTYKNPYETKMTGKIGTNLRGYKKREEIKNPMMAYDRPNSAKDKEAEKKKIGRLGVPNIVPLTDKLGEMMVTNSTAKKRYPSSNPKDDTFKLK